VTSPVNEKLTLKRVVDFVKDKGDENLRDINRKLQRVLEETLTKNMHLQRVSVRCCSVFYRFIFKNFCRDITPLVAVSDLTDILLLLTLSLL